MNILKKFLIIAVCTTVFVGGCLFNSTAHAGTGNFKGGGRFKEIKAVLIAFTDCVVTRKETGIKISKLCFKELYKEDANTYVVKFRVNGKKKKGSGRAYSIIEYKVDVSTNKVKGMSIISYDHRGIPISGMVRNGDGTYTMKHYEAVPPYTTEYTITEPKEPLMYHYITESEEGPMYYYITEPEEGKIEALDKSGMLNKKIKQRSIAGGVPRETTVKVSNRY